MADRTVHYEAAFETYLRSRALPYVAVDEAKRALFANAKLKSFDFVVYSQSGANLLVDVKGRSARGPRGSSLQTWVTEQDVADLLEWRRVFGDGFKAVFAFVYWIDAPLAAVAGTFSHGDRWYQMLGVDLEEYRHKMRRRSEKWETVAVPAQDFRDMARPFEDWL